MPAMPYNRSQLPISRRTLLAALRHLVHDEDGAAYTLSYVMVIPLYALLMCMIIELALMLTSKLGTVYAAYAAARTASVWSSATTWEKTQEKAKQAAIRTMTPFASGTQPLISSATPEALPDSAPYVAAYELYAKKRVSITYLLTKFSYATRHTKVEIEGPPEKWDADITAKVTYEFPFNVPGVGRIMGKRGLDARYYFTISSEVTLPNEGPQNEDKTLGIGYGTLD
jgi:hypothetical protein